MRIKLREVHARSMKEEDFSDEWAVSSKTTGNGEREREAVGAADLALHPIFAPASTASARRPQSSDKVGVADSAAWSTSAATPTLGWAAVDEMSSMQVCGVGVLGTIVVASFA